MVAVVNKAKRVKESVKAEVQSVASGLQQQVGVLIKELGQIYLERDELIKLMLTAYLGQQNLFIGGAPGTAKTALSRTVAGVFNTSTFYYLVSPTTQVEEVLGPVNLKALQAGEFERDLTGRLADTNLAIMDEIFKASSPLLNALLGLILERKVVNGKSEVHCPLISLVGCSNELPDPDEGLAPFWDRFVLRYWVDEISLRHRHTLMLRVANLETTPTVSVQFSELQLQRMQWEVAQLPIERDALKTLNNIVSKCGVPVSTRRLLQLVQLLKAWAYVQGDLLVSEEHLDLLSHTLWQTLEQREAIGTLIDEQLNQFNNDVEGILQEAVRISQKIQETEVDDDDELNFQLRATLAAADSKFAEMHTVLKSLSSKAKKESQKDFLMGALNTVNQHRQQVTQRLAELTLGSY